MDVFAKGKLQQQLIARYENTMASYVRRSYLILYNAASAVAWATVLGRVIAVFLFRGPTLVPVSVDTFVRNTQSFAALEILHSLLGMYLSLLCPSN